MRCAAFVIYEPMNLSLIGFAINPGTVFVFWVLRCFARAVSFSFLLFVYCAL